MGFMRRTVLACCVAALAAAPFAFAHDADTTIEGTLRTWHGDTEHVPVAVGAGVDTIVAGIVPLVSPDASTHALAGRRVRARGRFQGGAFAAGGGVHATSGTTVAAATGAKSVAVLLFNFTNNTAQPWTTSTVRGVVFDDAGSVNAYYQDASYGQLSLTGDAFGWYTIPDDNLGCDYTGWATKARAAATNAGVPLGSYQYVVYAFPQAASCGWAGLAYLPGTSSWINGAMNLRVVSHELGHNFGVHHASTLRCSSGGASVPLGSSCSADEYGDPFTVMGSSSQRHHVNWHRAQLGWLGDTITVTTSGIWNLAPAELTGTPRLLRVARNDGTYLNLEFRQPSGTFDNFGAGDPVVNGVSVRVAPDLGSLVQSKLVDAGAPATASFSDAPLLAGQSLTDPATGVQLTVVSVSPAGASVSIQFGPDSSDTEPPSAPGTLTGSAAKGRKVNLAWGAATDNVGVTGYRVYRGGTQVAQVAVLSYRDSPGRGTFTYTVRAVDAAGNVGPESNPVTVTT